MTATLHWLWRLTSALIADSRGTTAAILALVMTTLVGFAGLGAETGLWFSEKRGYQTAADAGAIAGAWQMADQLTAGQTASLTTTSGGHAWTEAVNNGAPNSSSNILVEQLSGPKARVTVTVPKSTLLASLFISSVTIKTVAVASVEANSACNLSLLTSGTGIAPSGNATLTLGDCWLASNSSSCANNKGNAIDIQDTAVDVTGTMIATGCIGLGGNSSCGNGLTCKADTQSTIPDPYTSLASNFAADITAAKATSAQTVANPLPTTLNPGHYTSDLNITANTTLNAGIYYMDGANFNVSGATVTGTDVTIVLTGTETTTTSKNGKTTTTTTNIGAVNLGAQGNLDISAPGTDTTITCTGCSDFQGIVIYQDPNAVVTANTTAVSLGANAGTKNTGMVLTGAVYAPDGAVQYQGTPSTNNCVTIVSLTMSFGGDSTLNDSGCNALSFKTPTVYTVSLVQ